MMSFELSKHRRARLWLDEELPCEFSATEEMRGEAQARASSSSASRIGLELFVPEGGKFSYGLLGASFLPGEPGGNVEIIVNVDGLGLKYPSPLSGKLDDVRVGLPREYGSAVVSGVQMVSADQGGLPAGRLVFAAAAHGVIGSNRGVFQRLGKLVAQILSLQPGNMSEIAIRELMEQ